MTMVARFRVATRASGRRRQVYVHVYDDRLQMAAAHHAARGIPFDPATDDTGGGLSSTGGYYWPSPDPGPIIVMRLWVGQLNVRTVAHEAAHAGAMLQFLDALPGWNARARGVLLGNNEPMAYAVGDITSDVLERLLSLGLLTDQKG